MEKIPNNKIFWRKKYIFAVTGSISQFNTGATSRINLLNSVTIESTSNMYSEMRKRDKSQITVAARKTLEKASIQKKSYVQKT